MCTPSNHIELLKELELTEDSKKKKVLLQMLYACKTCSEALEAKKTVGGESDCSCRRAFATGFRNRMYSLQQEIYWVAS